MDKVFEAIKISGATRIGYLGASVDTLFASPGFFSLFVTDTNGKRQSKMVLTELEARDLVRYLESQLFPKVQASGLRVTTNIKPQMKSNLDNILFAGQFEKWASDETGEAYLVETTKGIPLHDEKDGLVWQGWIYATRDDKGHLISRHNADEIARARRQSIYRK